MKRSLPRLTPKFILLGVLAVILSLCVAFLVYGLVSLGHLRVVLPKVAEITGVFRGDRTYLVLLQNNAELRPTGGFITAFAEVGFRGGIPTGIAINDVYSLTKYKDDIIDEAPYPMGEMLEGPNYQGYNFHDANWYPDLPKSSEDLLRFYEMEFPEKQIDGIVLLNFSVVEDLLKLIGGLPYKGQELAPNELFHTIEHEQNNIDRHNIEDITTRKSILGELMPIFVKRLLSDPGRWPAVSDHITELLHHKEISIWMRDPELQAFFTREGWTNIFPTPDPQQDIFAIVMANLGGMKSDRYLEKTFDHTVQIDRLSDATNQKKVTATTRVSIRHLGDYNAPLSHVYRGFTRIMIPREATLLEIDPALYDIYEEEGYTIVGRKITLEPKESITYEISYELPADMIEDNQYNLYIYRQSGMENAAYTAQVISPQDELLSSSDFDVRENVATFRTAHLIQDMRLQANIGRDTTPPRVSFQEFVDYNRLTIQFNEPVLQSDCENSENYSVVDTNTVVTTVTNDPVVLRVTCKEREATLYTRNIRTQYGEHFRVRLRNIRDWSNNIISPNPREITIVQRLERDKPLSEKPTDSR